MVADFGLKQNEAAMRKICAWCGKKIAPGVAPAATGTFRPDSICISCASSLLSTMPQDVGDFLDEITVPIFLVDGDCIIRRTNNRAAFLLGKERLEIEGLLGGEAFECAWARLPEGCGRTDHCPTCDIRRAVMKTYSTGIGTSQVPATLIHREKDGDEYQQINFYLSTEKFRDQVMLRIDHVKR